MAAFLSLINHEIPIDGDEAHREVVTSDKR